MSKGCISEDAHLSNRSSIIARGGGFWSIVYVTCVFKSENCALRHQQLEDAQMLQVEIDELEARNTSNIQCAEIRYSQDDTENYSAVM